MMQAANVSMDAEEAELWLLWSNQRARDARERLIATHSAWARGVARDVFIRVRALSADWQDYLQNAFVGLVQAVDHFDPAMGVPFRGFAIRRVRGAVFNGIRDLRSTGRERSIDEVLRDRVDSALGEHGGAVDELISAVSQLTVGVMLESDTERLVARSLTPYEHAQNDGLGRLIKRLLADLPERERMVLELHYLQFLPFKAIAELLEVTKGRVSQIHRQGLTRLRAKLAARQLADVL